MSLVTRVFCLLDEWLSYLKEGKVISDTRVCNTSTNILIIVSKFIVYQCSCMWGDAGRFIKDGCHMNRR